MRAYPSTASFIAKQDVTICVEPSSTFKIAFFRQDKTTALIPVSFPAVGSMSNVTADSGSGGLFFRSATSSAPQRWDTDWQWPSISFRSNRSDWPRDVYAAAIYPVDTNGNPTTSIGQQFATGQNITPAPPYSDSMALFILKPALPAEANIAYIIPTATYHAYNWTGNGCFYGGCPDVTSYTKVTVLRPGGGLGAVLREPTDDYDPSSPRQQFGHWDAPFIRWLKVNGFAIDFYTDMDLELINPFLLPGGEPWYPLVLSVGHHEYWSPNMRTNMQNYINAGGNYAVFSGNTCWWQVGFGTYRTPDFMTTVTKVGQWPNFDESTLLGTSWEYGAARWGDCINGQWKNTTRPNAGYTIQTGMATNWVFANTGLRDGQTFGDGTNDYLAGYECDGIPPTPVFPLTLAKTAPLSNGWNKSGQGAIVLKDPSSGRYKTRTVFNCGTTDWARVLTNTNAVSNTIVQQITRNVVTTLSDTPDELLAKRRGE